MGPARAALPCVTFISNPQGTRGKQKDPTQQQWEAVYDKALRMEGEKEGLKHYTEWQLP